MAEGNTLQPYQFIYHNIGSNMNCNDAPVLSYGTLSSLATNAPANNTDDGRYINFGDYMLFTTWQGATYCRISWGNIWRGWNKLN